MSGISSNTGLISGIDSGALINQLLSLEARPKTLLQQRIVQLQGQQAAYLDINSKLGALKTAATAFGTRRIFGTTRVNTTDDSVLTATSAVGATVGSYSFLVDRLVTTQQQLSRGFPDRASTPVGATSFTFESVDGRLDRDTELTVLNGGSGISRGSIDITDAAGNTATIDLSRVATVDEVLEAINSSEDIDVTASVDGNHFVVRNNAAGTAGLVIRNHGSSTTATTLGILKETSAGNTVTGTAVHSVVGATALQSLNDGNGVRISSGGGSGSTDFSVTITNGVDTRTIGVYLGEVRDTQNVITTARATTVQNVLDRVNTAGTQSGTAYLTAGVSTDGSGITLDTPDGYTITSVVDTSGAAEDLGIDGTPGTNSLVGSRVLAGLNSTLINNILGGDGLASGGIHLETRDGVSAFDISLDTGGSISDLLAQINSLDSTKIQASLNDTGTGITITDLTGGTGNLIISGAQAIALGIDTPVAGVASATVDSDRLQHRYISGGTSLASLNSGRGVGIGRFEITDSNGNASVVDIGTDSRTLGDVVSEINSRPINIHARVNDNGDGLIIEERTPLTGGSQKIKINDLSGTVAANLNIEGEAEDGDANNFIDGSFEKVVEFAAGDTLDDVVRKVNAANVGVTANVINDGSITSPYHLNFNSTRSGRAGRYTLEAGGVDLGLNTLAAGSDARVFYGSSDPASAVLLTSSTNDLDGLITGVNIDLHSTSDTPVSLTVSSDTSTIESAVSTFVSAYNTLSDRISTLTSYDATTQRRGTLLGDSTIEQIRQEMFGAVTAKATGVSGQYQYLSQVGIKFDRDGALTLDSTKFQAAMLADPQAVQDLLSAKVQNTRTPTSTVGDIPGVTVRNTSPNTYSSLGVFEKIGQTVDKYLDRTDGVLTRRKSNLDDQIAAQNDRIDLIDDRLDRRRDILQRQFAAMETALSQLQTQQSAISGIRGLTG